MRLDTGGLLFPEALPVTGEALDSARRLLDQYSRLMARDALHAAIVEIYDLDSICSFDQDFDSLRGLRPNRAVGARQAGPHSKTDH